jgi:anti-anti-sigma factor
MEPLVLETEKVAGATVVKLIGTADVTQVEVLDRRMTQVCAQHPPVAIFDMSKLTFIASISIAVLMRFRNSCTHWNGKMFLAGANEQVAGSFKRAKLDQVFMMVPSVEEALKVRTTSPSGG